MARIFLLGATGTIGRATLQALVEQGHDVICFVRRRQVPSNQMTLAATLDPFAGAEIRYGDVSCAQSLAEEGFRGEPFDALISCMASRTGAPKDAWAIDHDAHQLVLGAAKLAGVSHFILLSAICVQKPLLAFQHAKLAFEKALIESGIPYSIVRPTAFFKSLSGQVERVRKGKSFLLFGDGSLAACKPISDDDLGHYLAECLSHQDRRDKILQIGGPGDAITPMQQGERLFALLGREPKFKHVPVRFLDAIIAALDTAGWLVPAAKQKAELARIGRYYATESMLVWDAEAGRYDAGATPSTGTETLFDYYADLISGEVVVERGEHTVF
ncbi:NAD(P)H-binding protein [Parasphingorhabdus sp.]|uniref:NAD(P)H-binding protein n=1 Tax=Parasphingorhabdus sp. TaxID=2709688 RepID=UPI00359314CA